MPSLVDGSMPPELMSDGFYVGLEGGGWEQQHLNDLLGNVQTVEGMVDDVVADIEAQAPADPTGLFPYGMPGGSTTDSVLGFINGGGETVSDLTRTVLSGDELSAEQMAAGRGHDRLEHRAQRALQRDDLGRSDHRGCRRSAAANRSRKHVARDQWPCVALEQQHRPMGSGPSRPHARNPGVVALPDRGSGRRAAVPRRFLSHFSHIPGPPWPGDLTGLVVQRPSGARPVGPGRNESRSGWATNWWAGWWLHARACSAGSARARPDRDVEAVRARLVEPLRVAVGGRIKAGKSTLVNALLGQRVAATDVGECTKVVAWYRYDVQDRIEVHPRQGETRTLPASLDGRLPDDIGSAATDVDHITVWMSARQRLPRPHAHRHARAVLAQRAVQRPDDPLARHLRRSRSRVAAGGRAGRRAHLPHASPGRPGPAVPRGVPDAVPGRQDLGGQRRGRAQQDRHAGLGTRRSVAAGPEGRGELRAQAALDGRLHRPGRRPAGRDRRWQRVHRERHARPARARRARRFGARLTPRVNRHLSLVAARWLSMPSGATSCSASSGSTGCAPRSISSTRAIARLGPC